MNSPNSAITTAQGAPNAGLRKTLASMLVSLIVVGGSFWADIRSNDLQSSTFNAVQSEVTDKGTLVLDMHRIIRTEPSTTYTNTENQIELTNGKMWVNTRNSAYTTKFKVGAYTIDVPPAIVSLERKDGVTTFEVLSRIAQVHVGAQTIFVPQGKGVVLYDSKLKNFQKEIDQIRMSKLYKEFSLYTVTQKDPWYVTNAQKDTNYKDQLVSQLRDSIRERGPRVSTTEGSLVESFRSIGSTIAQGVSLSEETKNEYVFSDARRYFDTALYLEQIGKTKDAAQMLQQFKVQVEETKSVLQPHLRQLSDLTALATFGDQFYQAHALVNDLIESTVFESFEKNISQLFDILRMGISPEQNDYLVSTMDRLVTQIQKNVALLTEKQAFALSEVVHSMLTSNATLMREPYFRALSLIQDAAIKKATTRDTTIDTQQYYISQKLDEIRAVKKQLDDKKIDFQQARGALIFIAQTIDATKPLLSDSAFLPYFDEQYKEFAPFIAFLNSNEAASLHGSFNDDYVQYKEKVVEANFIQSLLNTATGGEALSAVDREQRAAKAGLDLRQTGLTNIQLAFDSVQGSSVVIISDSTFDGAHFAARYDTDRRIFTEVVYDSKPVANGIRLENLRTFLLVTRGKITLPANAGAETLVEKPVTDVNAKIQAAVTVLKKNLAQAGITVDNKYIDTTHFEDGVIRVLLATRGEEPSLKLFSFEITADLTTASHLEVQTVLGKIPANDSFSLKELAFRVDQLFERAAFEKSKEAELPQPVPTGEATVK